MHPAGNTRTRIQGLDLLRGAAILLVLLRHSWPEYFGGGGIVGVVAFFTLSGYLITGLLASDVRRFGRIRYARFYRNRAIRLVPALLFLLLGFTIAEGVFNVSGTRDQVLRSVLTSLTYTMNIPGFNHGSTNLNHLWTLANEEQFYILWPVLIVIGIRFRKLRLIVALAAAALILATVFTLVLTFPDIGKIYSRPTTWTISMVIGAAAQLGADPLSRVLQGRRAIVGAGLGCGGLLFLTFLPDAKDNILMYLLGGPIIGLCTVLVIWKVRDWGVVPAPARPLVWLGIVSYAAYLWNYPVSWWLMDGGFGAGWQFAAIALTLMAAVVSWFLVETPFNRLRARFEATTRQKAVPPKLSTPAI